MFNCKILADSVAPSGKRLTTYVVTYPRSIHSELLTHRILSKSSSSSRAIPVKKLMDQILGNPALPVFWGSNKPGMQAGAELPADVIEECKADILMLRNVALMVAERLEKRGMHKQDANRYLEPWMFITVIVSGTEWDNFFDLRCHPAAHPSLQKIAFMMRDARLANAPTYLKVGEWHVPFGDRGRFYDDSMDALKVAAARCARVSYLTHDGYHEPIKDLALANSLISMGHWSPFEHIAQALEFDTERSGNFIGFKQMREELDLNFIKQN